jgi:TRAP-type C4-dicarboxylate transport system permease small subunit
MEEETKEVLLPAWRRGLDRLIGTDRVACEVVMVAMMVLITTEVVLRSIFNYSLEFTDEISGYLLVATTFLAMGISLHEGALFRVDFLYRRFPFRVRRFLEFLFSAVSLGFALLVDYQIFRFLVSSIERGMAAPTLLGTPLYLPQLVMPLGMTFIVLLLLVETGRTFQAWWVGGPEEGRKL